MQYTAPKQQSRTKLQPITEVKSGTVSPASIRRHSPANSDSSFKTDPYAGQEPVDNSAELAAAAVKPLTKQVEALERKVERDRGTTAMLEARYNGGKKAQAYNQSTAQNLEELAKKKELLKSVKRQAGHDDADSIDTNPFDDTASVKTNPYE